LRILKDFEAEETRRISRLFIRRANYTSLKHDKILKVVNPIVQKDHTNNKSRGFSDVLEPNKHNMFNSTKVF